jgi:hypothetical protein
MHETDLSRSSEEEFDAELDRRIDRVQAALDAMKDSFRVHLRLASTPLPSMTATIANAMWFEMEASGRD